MYTFKRDWKGKILRTCNVLAVASVAIALCILAIQGAIGMYIVGKIVIFIVGIGIFLIGLTVLLSNCILPRDFRCDILEEEDSLTISCDSDTTERTLTKPYTIKQVDRRTLMLSDEKNIIIIPYNKELKEFLETRA